MAWSKTFVWTCILLAMTSLAFAATLSDTSFVLEGTIDLSGSSANLLLNSSGIYDANSNFQMNPDAAYFNYANLTGQRYVEVDAYGGQSVFVARIRDQESNPARSGLVSKVYQGSKVVVDTIVGASRGSVAVNRIWRDYNATNPLLKLEEVNSSATGDALWIDQRGTGDHITLTDRAGVATLGINETGFNVGGVSVNKRYDVCSTSGTSLTEAQLRAQCDVVCSDGECSDEINAAFTDKLLVYLAPGTYQIQQDIVINKKNATLECLGKTTIKSTSAHETVLQINNSGIVVDGCDFDANQLADTALTINIDAGESRTIEDVTIKNSLFIHPKQGISDWGVQVIDWNNNWQIKNLKIVDSTFKDFGNSIHDNFNFDDVDGLTFLRNRMENTSYNLNFYAVKNSFIDNNVFSVANHASYGVTFHADTTKVSNNIFENFSIIYYSSLAGGSAIGATSKDLSSAHNSFINSRAIIRGSSESKRMESFTSVSDKFYNCPQSCFDIDSNVNNFTYSSLTFDGLQVHGTTNGNGFELIDSASYDNITYEGVRLRNIFFENTNDAGVYIDTRNGRSTNIEVTGTIRNADDQDGSIFPDAVRFLGVDNYKVDIVAYDDRAPPQMNRAFIGYGVTNGTLIVFGRDVTDSNGVQFLNHGTAGNSVDNKFLDGSFSISTQTQNSTYGFSYRYSSMPSCAVGNVFDGRFIVNTSNKVNVCSNGAWIALN